jgi:hypothetical protein
MFFSLDVMQQCEISIYFLLNFEILIFDIFLLSCDLPHGYSKSNVVWWGKNYILATLNTKHIFGWDVRTGLMSFALCCELPKPPTFIKPHPFNPVRKLISNNI